MVFKQFLVLCLGNFAAADLRMASQPHSGYQLKDQGTTKWNFDADCQKGQMHYKYMEPSTFGYKGLENQKKRNYDNFLRSNIDNEQDNRNFNDEAGKDHLPFRTYEAEINETHNIYRRDGRDGQKQAIKQCPLKIPVAKTVKPGETMTVPLRWNNPHASEMEVNIWIFEHDAPMQKPIVVPIKKPTCSGEGHQDNVIGFTVPTDFSQLGSKIKGFKGCREDSKPMCTLQIYAHSVESRTYAIGFPIVIPTPDLKVSSVPKETIEEASKDPWWDLSGLRELCLPATDSSADISTAKPRWARLVSDVYNHAYQNSDYSPYSGQQHESISRNLHASALNKMEVGNRGELGKSILTTEANKRLAYLRGLENRVYKNYEALANKIIKSVETKIKNTGTVGVQSLANCFRCQEAGSTTTKRQQTNTYIPSFQLPTSYIAAAKTLVPAKYAGLITESGVVQIYAASLKDLLPFYYQSRYLGLIYQDAVLKSTPATMSDVANFKKRDATGKADAGKYAATEARKKFLAARGCPSHCLSVSKKHDSFLQDRSWNKLDLLEIESQAARRRRRRKAGGDRRSGPISPPSLENPTTTTTTTRTEAKTASDWAPTDQAIMAGPWINRNRGLPVLWKIDLGDNQWMMGVIERTDLKMILIEITGETTFRTLAAGYTRSIKAHCRSQATAGIDCFSGIRGVRTGLFTARAPFEKNKATKISSGKARGIDESAWYCVANINKKFVTGPFSDIESARQELNKNAGTRSNRQMICEMSSSNMLQPQGVPKTDPHWIGGKYQGGGTNSNFQKYWFNWNDIKHMNNMCAQSDMCKRNGILPQPQAGTWFCVSRLSKKKVSGPFPDVASAKAVLNKEVAGHRNRQMICEMSKAGAKSDPSTVGGLNQKAFTANGFQSWWWTRSSTDINRMNAMCNANVGCSLNVPPDEIEGPLFAGAKATNVTGDCKPCLQFFGKQVHPTPNSKVTPLAKEISSSGREPANMASRDRLADNPNLIQTEQGQSSRLKRRKKGSKRKQVRQFLERADDSLHYFQEMMGLEALQDVTPLPELYKPSQMSEDI